MKADQSTLLIELDACPACRSRSITPFYASTNKRGPLRFEQLLFERLDLPWRPVRFDVCGDCGLAFLNPRWSGAALGRIYGPENIYRTASMDFFRDEHPGAETVDYFKNIDPSVGRPDAVNFHHLERARFVRRHLPASFPERPLMADVGAGFGGAQKAIQRAGFDYRGFESSPEMVSQAARFGRTLENVPFADVASRLSGSAHVVYTAQFLEHVDEPVGCLAALRPCLRDDGYVFVDVPVCHYKVLDDAWFSTLGQRRTTMNWGHMTLFDVGSLANVMILAGYEPTAHAFSLGNLWMLGKKSDRVPSGPLRDPGIRALDLNVHVIDTVIEPVAERVQSLRRLGRDALASVGLLDAFRAARLRRLER